MKKRELKKNLSSKSYPEFIYLVDEKGESQKHIVDSIEDWKALQDVCEMLKMKIIIPSGKK